MSDAQKLDDITASFLGRAAADGPPNTHEADAAAANIVPPATGTGATPEDDDLPEQTLEEAFGLAVDPEPGEEQPEAQTEETAEPALTKSELEEIRAERDRLLAEKAQFEAAQSEAKHIADWEGVWSQGYAFYDNKMAGTYQKYREEGHDEDVAEALAIRAWNPSIKDWEAKVRAKENYAHAQFYGTKHSPSVVDTLVSEHGLSAEDKTKLLTYHQKYKDPDLLKDVATLLANERARVQQRDKTVIQTARENVATTMQREGFGPGTPASTGRRPYKFKGGEMREQEDRAMALGLLNGLASKKR